MTDIADLARRLRKPEGLHDLARASHEAATRLERIAAAWAQADAACVFTEDDQFNPLRAAIEGHEP